MCGVAGYLGPLARSPEGGNAILQSMTSMLSHRGPDDAGQWLDTGAGVAIGHRRLAVIDLSAAGHQPMLSPSGRFVVAFNGEIYNHVDIRNDLPDWSWRGTSDTETLVGAIDQWGFESALRRAVGMFAIAIWDRETRTLVLARDRMGEKPLYYGWQGEHFLFASELSAIECHPGFADDVDAAVVGLYMQHGYVPTPHTIYRGIRKVPPGSYVRVITDKCSGCCEPPIAYWTLAETCASGVANRFSGTEQAAASELEGHLVRAIATQMTADVPLGALLSGGVDSSLVVALMQAQSSRPVKTFTVGFAELGYDEARHARAVAQHLGTEHTELYVGAAEAMQVIPRLASIYGEPFGDASSIPTVLIAELARRDVVVSLSGDGGDELFGGYTRYQSAAAYWSRIRRVPHSARALFARVAAALSGITGRYPAMSAVLASDNDVELYRALVTQWYGTGQATLAGADSLRWSGVSDDLLSDLASCERMMLLDSVSYLTDDVLCKVDRAAMSVSLEVRVPLLDHRVIAFAWRVPLGMKIGGGVGKRLLRRVLSRYVPGRMTDRPKMGFGVPVDHWIRGPLREWAEDLLGERQLEVDGYLHPHRIRRRWRQHCSGHFNWRDPLWIALMFQAWLRERQRVRKRLP